jgi:hypothetical protein
MIYLFIPFLLFLLINQIINLNNKYRFSFSKNHKLVTNWILFPARGYPLEIPLDSILIGLKKYQIFISSDLDLENIKIEGEICCVSQSSNDEKISLTNIIVHKFDKKKLATSLKFSKWIHNNCKNIYEIEFNLSSKPLSDIRKTKLYDLVLTINNNKIIKNSCIYISKDKLVKQIFLATDIHVSKRWDDIEQKAKQVLPKGNNLIIDRQFLEYDSINYFDYFSAETFRNSFSNPNQNFIHFIKSANQQHREGKLDFIILTGDLVDFKYINTSNKINHDFSETEWYYFLQIMDGSYPGSERLEVPCYTTTGNHDYRLYPYGIQAYGLMHCGIPENLTNQYLRKSNENSITKYKLSDINALRINTGENHSLDYYYLNINPCDNYFIKCESQQFIFLDTNADAFCYFKNIFSKRGFSLFTDIENPSSHGLEDSQIDYLNNVMDMSKNILIFCHAPILNSYIPNKKIDLINEIEISFPDFPEKTDFNRKFNYQKLLRKDKLNSSVCFNNQLGFIESLISNPNNIVVFSGHNHYNKEYGLSKKDNRLFEGNYSKLLGFESSLKDKILFLQTPSLAHIKKDLQYGEEPSYRILNFSEENLVSAKLIPIKQKPFDIVGSFLTIDRTKNPKELFLDIDKERLLFKSDSTLIRFIVFSESSKKKSTIDKNKVFSDDELQSCYYFYNSEIEAWIFDIKSEKVKIKIKDSVIPCIYQFAIESFVFSDTKMNKLEKKIRRFQYCLEL